jgi:3-oxoadipate CoA-transferase beta subunit
MEADMSERANPSVKPLNRAAMAARVARDIPEGWYVNLGIGLPTMVGDHVPADREIIFHSENGILGMGPAPTQDAIDPWLVNAGKQNVTLLSGAALVHQADSFAMIRGGHLDLCVLGAYEVAENGDLANWTTSGNDRISAVGGAMDLSVGAARVWVMTDHTTKDGRPKLVERCLYPLTAVRAVDRIYTDLAVLDVTARGFTLVDIVAGLSFEDLQTRTGAKLHRSEGAPS